MKKSEIKNILSEIIQEELKEINHTTDSSGESVVAVGAPGSIERFATEHPEVIKAMRDWVKDCQWGDVQDESDVDDMSNTQIIKGVERYYEGGVKAFLRDSNLDVELPVGIKEWQGDEGWNDGYSNEYQRAYAHSQATQPRSEDETKKAEELVKKGKYVVMHRNDIHCKTTDAVLGCYASIDSVHDNMEDAQKKAEEIHKYSDGVDIISPESIKAKEHKPTVATTPEDDIPFEEGVGYVHAKDRAKDPKSIPGEHWRIKFQSTGDLKKHGNTEKSKVSENMKSKQFLQTIIREAIQEVKDESYQDQEKQELMSMKRIQSYAHWGFKNANTKPTELKSTFERIVKEIDGLVSTHDQRKEVPGETEDSHGERGYMGYTPKLNRKEVDESVDAGGEDWIITGKSGPGTSYFVSSQTQGEKMRWNAAGDATKMTKQKAMEKLVKLQQFYKGIKDWKIERAEKWMYDRE
jgi:hypothetical protein